MKRLFKYILILAIAFALPMMAGCQTAGGYIGKAQDAKKAVAAAEMAASIRAACSSNYDVVSEKYGSDLALWNAFNRICFPNSRELPQPIDPNRGGSLLDTR